jgi:transaldolase
VTTNPTLFASWLADAREYENDLADLAARHVSPGEAARLLAAADVRGACDILLPTHQQTSGLAGWVSPEVDPGFADNAYATLADVRALRRLVDRPNVMIKIPATSAGIAAILAATAEGHSINATLIFSVERYREVLAPTARGSSGRGETAC